MKTLYLDCGMGAAGDMLTAALVELLPDSDKFMEKLNALSVPDVQFRKESAVKCGITGTHISVIVGGIEESEEMYVHEHSHEHHYHEHSDEHKYEHHHHEHSDEYKHEHHHHGHSDEYKCEHHHHGHGDEQEHYHEHSHEQKHHHSGMHEIEQIVADLDIPDKVREDVLEVYNLIAEAESHAHGKPITEIHFHEVGTVDAVADITAVCLLLHEISPDEIVVSPVHVGSGHVKCAHGILPVPAPATAFILKDVPIYGGSVDGELCTPTGAALLKHFATRFGDMPVMKTQAIGYGMGKKDFQMANCVRAMLGETADKTDTVWKLSCNVDDMTAEEIGFAKERFFAGGAKEVYTIPVGMKKSRPGTLICVLCREQDREEMIGLLFKYTTTIGVREVLMNRYVLERRIEAVITPYGEVRRKISSGFGITKMKYEYDDLSRIAEKQNISLDEVRRELKNCSL